MNHNVFLAGGTDFNLRYIELTADDNKERY